MLMASSKWFTLPPFIPTLVNVKNGNQISSPSSITALKWVTRCCPNIPKTLVHKLFRLRQVRTQPPNLTSFKRLSPKDTLNSGDLIFLPHSVQQIPPPTHKHKHHSHSLPPLTDKQINFIRTLLIYKDPALLVLNKPPGLPVQGGINIKHSLDVLAAASLNYDYSEPPRLVHRLDRDCSGILVMARTHTSATILHSIFRDKTSTASHHIDTDKTILQRRYWAMVIGCPRRPRGLITASLGKVVVDNGKSDRITVVDKSTLMSSQHAVTEYKVIGSSSNGYTWLELSPLTGRKHQLRVHCAEVLGTPIVGDYKYGWQAHKKWGLFEDEEDSSKEILKEEAETLLPFGLNMKKGSICEKRPRLHLHCKQIVLPNICESLQNVESGSSRSCDLSEVESLELVAALPLYMQTSWEFTNS
ncbi:hypothetical protein Lal_00027608 [Lupinus albus]|uniref:Putative 23S rRNA pseudouridine(955/2504/2580) synthase n=1 Tax=Lupinus albus TaxID=3870 RepID=A0A6A4QFY8_LUPAL|nr:putative 23S rRNA pseudouridine(955/2504/2580) synthase [Lupinus albus]KAF1873570.1 hypothetical protein Lal_00027608 [Lupinus albus]